MIKIGLLSKGDCPFTGYVIRELIARSLKVDVIIMCLKKFTEKHKQDFAERVGVRFPLISLVDFERQQIPVYHVKQYSSTICAKLVQDLNIDLLLNMGSDHIMRPIILNAPKIGIINYHPGLLPKFRGCTAVEWAIYFNQQIGNTIHFMDETVDTGPIIIQEPLTFTKNVTYQGIRGKVFIQSCKLLAKGVEKVIAENLTPINLPAQSDKSNYFKVISKDKMKYVLSKIESGTYEYQMEEW